MRGLETPKLKTYAFAFLASTAFWAFFAYQVTQGVLEERISQRHDVGSQSLGLTSPHVRSTLAQPERVSDLQRRLLVDSVLAIIQAYYVDSERVSHRPLLEITGEQLATYFPQLSLAHNDSELTLGFEDEVLLQVSKKGVTYHYLVTAVLTLVEALDVLRERNRIFLDDSVIGLSSEAIVMNALLSALDAHSSLLTTDEYRELRQGTEGEFGGLGILVAMRESILTVVKPLPRSPAMRAGIREDDRIVKIDGNETFGYSLDDLVEYMRGPPGSEVSLLILRPGNPFPISLVLRRERINVDSVSVITHQTPDANIAQIKVESFASRTSLEVANAIQFAKAAFNNELDGIVLDFRSNPGGLLDQAVKVADIFLSDGTIVATKGRRTEVELANKNHAAVVVPIIALINSETASASEIVAGALQDHKRAIVIGQPSFGKGSVQTIFELPGDQALKLTVARYYTPLNRSIQSVGISPDILLHPVFSKVHETVNLLGPYRYRSERFLVNRLQRGEGDSVLGDALDPLLTGYYLNPAPNSSLGVTQAAHDEELEIAKLIISETKSVYKSGLPQGANRSSHWLAVAAPKVIQRIQESDRDVGLWLEKTHKISWRKRQPASAGELQVDFGVAVNGAQPLGTRIEIPWEVSNKANKPIGRVSVFLWSQTRGFETMEMLVGEVEGASSVSGAFSVDLSHRLGVGVIPLSLGVAVDGRPLHGSTAVGSLETFLRDQPEIELSFTFRPAEGSEAEKHLKPSEIADLVVVVTNKGKTRLEPFEARLYSFAGEQVHIFTDRFRYQKAINPGESGELSWQVKASDKLAQKKGFFGVELKGGGLVAPYRKSISLPMTPNVQRVSNLFAH